MTESSDTKAMTIRLPRDQAEELEAVAQVEGRPVAEVVREAIATHLQGRLADDAFQRQLRRKLERNRKILERLSRRAPQ